MKKITFVRSLVLFLALVMLCGLISSCASPDYDPMESQSDLVEDEGKDGEKTPEQEKEERKAHIRYRMTDPQKLRLTKNEYNDQNQLLSVTALDTKTMAPAYSELYKLDRVYFYDEDGLLSSVWVSFGYRFELSYEDVGEDGTKVATGSSQHRGEDLSLRVTLSEENVILKEEYADGVSTITMEYDDEGNLTKESRNVGSESSLSFESIAQGFRVTMFRGEDAWKSYDVVCNEDGTIAALSDGTTTMSYAYDEDGCCVSSQMNGMVCNMTYNPDCQIIMSEYYFDDMQEMGSFEYDEDGRMIKYIGHSKDSYSNSEGIFTYLYGEDGVVERILCEYIEYDENDVELSRRSETVE